MATETVALLCAPAPPGLAETSIPLWLDDDTIVHRAVGAKRSHPPNAHFWPRLAVLGQTCAAIVRAGDGGADASLLRTAQRLAAALAADLPPAGDLDDDPRQSDLRWGVLRRAALPLADLADCAHDIALTIADPHQPHLHDLADLTDDTRLALTVYGRVTTARGRNRRDRPRIRSGGCTDAAAHGAAPQDPARPQRTSALRPARRDPTQQGEVR